MLGKKKLPRWKGGGVNPGQCDEMWVKLSQNVKLGVDMGISNLLATACHVMVCTCAIPSSLLSAKKVN